MTSFLGRGIIVADLRHDGTVDVNKGRLFKILVKTPESCAAQSFRTFFVTSSGPGAFNGSTMLSTCLTLCSHTVHVG